MRYILLFCGIIISIILFLIFGSKNSRAMRTAISTMVHGSAKILVGLVLVGLGSSEVIETPWLEYAFYIVGGTVVGFGILQAAGYIPVK